MTEQNAKRKERVLGRKVKKNYQFRVALAMRVLHQDGEGIFQVAPSCPSDAHFSSSGRPLSPTSVAFTVSV